MKITYTSILSAICSSILLLVFLSVYIWKKQENYSLYEVKLLIFCTKIRKLPSKLIKKSTEK